MLTDIMMTLFDDEQILKAYVKDIKDNTAQETARETEREMAEISTCSGFSRPCRFCRFFNILYTGLKMSRGYDWKITIILLDF